MSPQQQTYRSSTEKDQPLYAKLGRKITRSNNKKSSSLQSSTNKKKCRICSLLQNALQGDDVLHHGTRLRRIAISMEVRSVQLKNDAVAVNARDQRSID